MNRDVFQRFLPVVCILGGGLFATHCLTPPAVQGGSTAVHAGRVSAVAVPPPRAFTHSAAELLAKVRLGWNLGNSLDAPDGETGWGNPEATPELFKAVAAAGFGIVRIPVTWSAHTGAGPAFTIDPSWLDRVEQVVGYAHAAGLYAIINVHHDGADGFKGVQWISLKDSSGATTEENNAAVRARFVAVWSQIAKRFAKYGEELLFESMNEIHDGYGTPDPRHFAIINDLDQRFVDVVRASGGNNAQRSLIVPGYNTNIDHTLAGFKAPTDPTPARIVLSIHYYDPYLFALEGKTHAWGHNAPGRDNWGQEDMVVGKFDKLKATFIDRGIPVLLGEFGATHQEAGDYQRYYVEYVAKAAIDRGIVPVYWDNGAVGTGSDKFGLFDRNTDRVAYPDEVAALKRAATRSYVLADVAPPAAPH
jgi:aryl-phospho-beta-D-glucosidase BglC (GH1 family)